MAARETARKTASAAVAVGLWCVASVSATSLTLDNSARGTWIYFHQMKTSVAQAQMPLCAAVGGSAWRASVSARSE